MGLEADHASSKGLQLNKGPKYSDTLHHADMKVLRELSVRKKQCMWKAKHIADSRPGTGDCIAGLQCLSQDYYMHR